MSIKAKVSPRQILKETFLLSVNHIVDQPLVNASATKNPLQVDF